jgi:hypothetical protein
MSFVASIDPAPDMDHSRALLNIIMKFQVS